MNNPNKITRRKAIGGIGARLTVAAVSYALGNEAKANDKHWQDKGLEDPATKYPKPPFKEQSQKWPGLAGQMDPRPDHGEKSYKGSGRLSGRKALITGGDSGIGRAAAIAYGREGTDVAINYLPEEEQDAQEVIALIKAEGRKAIAIPGDIREEAFCKKLVEEAVRGLGGLDILVNNAGRQRNHQSILDITTEQLTGQ
jgi:hypothetical protein